MYFKKYTMVQIGANTTNTLYEVFSNYAMVKFINLIRIIMENNKGSMVY